MLRAAAVVELVPAGDVFIRLSFIALVIFHAQILFYIVVLMPGPRGRDLFRVTIVATRILSKMAFVS